MKADMLAAVLYGKEDLRLEHVPIPQAAPGELVLQVGAALTCGTDLKVYRRGYHAMMLQPPIPFGHEVAGVVTQVGEGVTPSKGVIASSLSTPHPATSVSSAATASRTSARTSSSTTAPTPSTSASPPASSPKTPSQFPPPPRSSTPPSPNPSPVSSAASKRAAPTPETP